MNALSEDESRLHPKSPPRNVALVTADAALADELARELQGSGEFKVVDSEAKLADLGMMANSAAAFSLLVDTQSPPALQPALWAQLAKRRDTVFCHRGDADHAIGILAKHPGLRHVHGLAKGAQLSLCQRMAMAKPSHTPVAFAYLSKKAALQTHRMSSYSSHLPSLDQLVEDVAHVTRVPDFAATVRTCAWELLSNAFFDAPHDKDTGERRFANKRKTDGVSLAAGEEITLSYGLDEHLFALGVRDPFGTLLPDNVIAGLVRCRRKGEDQVGTTPKGAGIGIYMILNAATRIEFHITPGVATEAVLIIPVDLSPRELAAKPRSLHFYQAEES